MQALYQVAILKQRNIPHWCSDDGRILLVNCDCLDLLPTLEAGSVDAVVTDPPAGIGFMGKEWDRFGAPRKGNGQAERDAYRAENPDRPGYAFQGGSDLGLKDRTAFIAFLTAALAECLGVAKPGARLLCWAIPRTSHWTGTAIEDAGWVIEDRISHLFGQGFPKAKSKLKPACEDWWLARKPSKGVPALPGLDGCRIGTDDVRSHGVRKPGCQRYGGQNHRPHHDGEPMATIHGSACGRWPANVVLDEEAAGMLDEQSGELSSHATKPIRKNGVHGNCYAGPFGKHVFPPSCDTGGASRFFYVAKASAEERGQGNTHPTVKSLALMSWLVKLITPPGGIVLDPFAGSGSTGVAAVTLGHAFVGIEQSAEYHAIAERRIRAAQEEVQREAMFFQEPTQPKPQQQELFG